MDEKLTPEQKISGIEAILNNLAGANGIVKCQLICAADEFLKSLRNDFLIMEDKLRNMQPPVPEFVSAEVTKDEPET